MEIVSLGLFDLHLIKTNYNHLAAVHEREIEREDSRYLQVCPMRREYHSSVLRNTVL